MPAKWLSNVVLVNNANIKWQMCVDFTNLYKTYSKDSFLLLWIDLIVDSTAGQGHQFLSFMDAYLENNQIKISSRAVEKMLFITNYGLYFYQVIPFG